MNDQKNIIIVVNAPVFNGNTAASSRLRNYAKALAQKGNKVIVCTAISNSQLDLHQNIEIRKNIFSIPNKKKEFWIKYLGNNKSVAFNIGFFRRVNQYINTLEGESSIFLYPSTITVFEVIGSLYLRLIKKRKVFYEANEVRRHGLYNIIYSSNHLKKIAQKSLVIKLKLEYKIAEYLSRYYTGIVAISKNIEQYYQAYNDHILRIPILSDTTKKPFEKKPAYHDQDDFNICFTGSIVLKKEGFENILYMISELKKKNFKVNLHLYGTMSEGTKNTIMKTLATKMGIESNIIYHGLVNSGDLIAEMQKHHLLLLARPNTLQAQYGFSTKLSEYLVSGVPVLVTDVSDNALYITDNVNGYIIPPDNTDLLIEKTTFIIKNYNENAEKIVNNAFNTAKQHFHFSNYSEKLNEFLKN